MERSELLTGERNEDEDFVIVSRQGLRTRAAVPASCELVLQKLKG